MHEEKGKVQFKTKIQIKQMQNVKTQDPKKTYHRETGRTWTGTWIKADADRDTGPHLSNKLMAEKRAYDHFHANFGIYQFGRERKLRSDLTSCLSSCTQI